ncbi:non-ribosomal peptide synthetase [Pseudomonas sp. NBRC 111130]|uniref:non-ribosomal peptide synthetase n=1 Tax=Pseudomonas sp. NBRC 111130 TaxID=1661045 RepID=UPI0006D41AE6|nr:non-ribosomal peptide synthetase [Pseudomonas sp. NBRC 111130]
MTRNTTLRIAEKFIGLPLEQRRQFLARLRQDGKDFGLLPIPVSRHGLEAIPLSYAQQRLLFLWQLDPQSAAYNMAAGLRLRGKLDHDRLQGAFDALIERHEALRTVFQVDGEQPLQRVLAAEPLALRHVDLGTAGEAELARQVEDEVSRPFDLLNGPLLRASLFRLGQDEYVLVVCMHHIVCDGWSMDVMVREFVQCYQAGPQSLSALPLQYADYAVWQRRWLEAGEGERQLQHWREQLGDDHPLLEVAADFPRPPVQSLQGETLKFDFGGPLSQRLRDAARAQGVTLFMLMLTGYAVFLSRHSGQRDIRIGVPNANRGREEVEGLIGFFVNTQVLRCVVDERLSLNELLVRVREATFAAQANQELPFEQLVEVLAPERSLGHNPLFQAKFNQNVGVQKQTALQLPGLAVSEYPLRKEGTHFDLALDITDDGSLVHGEMTYASDLYQRSTIEGFIAALRELFDTLLTAPDTPLHTLVKAPVAEVASHREQPALVLQRWDEQVRRQPEGIAAACAGQQLSHAELDSQANRLAHQLRDLGVATGAPVAVLMERSLDWLVCLLGVLKAGGVYLPLDSKAPAERLQGMLQRSGAQVLLCEAAELRQQALAASGCQVQPYAPERWASLPGDAPETGTLAGAPAYVIHTSGSTGQPKGVVVSHGALASYVDGLLQRLDLATDASMALVSTIAADLGHTVVFGALCSGRTLHVLPETLGFDPDAFAAYMAQQRIGVLKIVPSHLNGLLQAANAGDVLPDHALIVGGEACSPALYQKVRELKPGCRFINHYGPSETTVGVLTHELQGAVTQAVPLGTVLPGASVRVLDDVLNGVPARVAGELYIGGDSLAQGYLGQAALTAERFVPDPFGAPGTRLYRSGDRVQRDNAGLLHFLGRADDQVKIRGYRVEPGEVGRVLRGLAGVHDAVVLAVPQGDDAAQLQLVGWCVAGTPQLSVEALREQLQALLPDYLVPAHLLLLERLPLTANGKLDRRALPQPQVHLKRHVAASTPLEQQLLAIWQAVLKREDIGVEDNFFELGGDSILSLQIIARAKRQGIRLSPRQLFEKQTIAQLAQVAKVITAAAKPAAVAQVSGGMPLLPVQARFFELGLDQPGHYNQAVMLQPRQALTASIVEQALALLVNQHDALRLAFSKVDGSWHAEHRTGAPGGLLWHRQAADAAQLLAIAEEAQGSLDLAQGPLLRAVLCDLADGGQRLLLVIHHLVVDGVSWRVLLEDLEQACVALLAGRTPALAEKGTAFKVWAEGLVGWAQAPARDAELAYWQATLAGQTGDLPAARRDAGLQVRHARTVRCRLDADTTQSLLQQAPAAYRTQVNDLLLTALARVLCRWTGQVSALVQLEGHGREDLFDGVDLSRTVGWFTSLFPVALTPTDDLSGSLKAIKEQLRGVPGRGIGHGVLRYLGSPAQQAALQALPQARVTFNYLGQFDQGFGEDRLFAPALESVGATQAADAPLGNWLSVNGQVLGGELELGFTFSQAMFDEPVIASLADDYAGELAALVAHCLDRQAGGATPADFPLAGLTQAQLDALPVDLRQVENIYPLAPMQEGMLFHSLYDGQASSYVNRLRLDLDELDPERFIQAWQQALDQHESLRAGFAWEQGLEAPRQVVLRHVQLPVERFDWAGEADIGARLEALAQAEQARAFDLGQAPLLRVVLVRTGPQRHHLIYTSHHILMDGWSNSLLFAAVMQAYSGQPAALAQATRSNYLGWLQQQDRAAADAFWKAQLLDLDGPTLLGGTRDASEAGQGAVVLELGEALSQALKHFAQAQQVTLNSVLQAAWVLLLQRRTGQRRPCFGATVSGRPAELPGIEQQLGLFINTLPVAAEPQGQMPVADWVRKVQALNLRLREYEYLPLYAIQAAAGRHGEALFDSLLVFENYPLAQSLSDSSAGLRLSGLDYQEYSGYPLTLIAEARDQMQLTFAYQRQVLGDAQVQQIAAELRHLLQGFANAPHALLGSFGLVDAEAHSRIVKGWNDTARDYPGTPYLHQLFEQQAARQPQAPALTFADRTLSYAELNAEANRLALYLRGQGVGPDVLVGIAAERSVEMVVGLLAILKAGGAYVPLDPEYPQDRLAYMFEDSGITLLLTQSHLRDGLPIPAGLTVLDLDRTEAWSALGAHNPDVALHPENLAYVIYTSGSTGKPKGAGNRHIALHNRLAWMQEAYQLTAADSVLQKTPFSFDVSVWEFFWPLMEGARLVMALPGDHRDPARLAELITREQISTLHFVPSMLQAFVGDENAARCTSLQRIICSGEALPVELQRQTLALLPQSGLYNLYGPTEAAIDVTHWTCVEEGKDSVPIGQPIANLQTYVLDGELNPVSPGVTGELYLGGIGLARGYHRRPSLTAERFVISPFGAGLRLYRTGDLARQREDGVIEYAGRIDHQVKIRGLRIELGEIEARLQELEAVREAVVVAGEGQLVAYLVAEQADSLAAIKAHLAAVLPDYMVPAQWVLLEQMPLSPNGKLDRKALPKPELGQSRREYVAPRNELEQRLAAIWQEVLQVERVGLTDNFFELGGHSLLLVRLVSRLKTEFSVELPIQDAYLADDLAALAALVTRNASPAEQDYDAIFDALDELEAFDA